MELEIMTFVISVPIPIPIPMLRFQSRDLQMAINYLGINIFYGSLITFIRLMMLTVITGFFLAKPSTLITFSNLWSAIIALCHNFFDATIRCSDNVV